MAPPPGIDPGLTASKAVVLATTPWRNLHSVVSAAMLAPQGARTRLDSAMRDEVDNLVAAWKRERPDLDLSPLEVLSRVTRLARHLDRARRSAFANHDIEGWSFDVLTALRRSGAPYQLSAGQLVQQTLVTSGTMTNRINRLEELGWVTRLADPSDGRSVLVQLLPAGQRVVDAALADLLASETELLQGLNEKEREQLADLLRRLNAPIDAEN